jgi:hypothetical protein
MIRIVPAVLVFSDNSPVPSSSTFRLCYPLDGQLTQDSTQDGIPDPSMLNIQKLAEQHPVLVASNYAFFPDTAREPILWTGISASPVALLILRGETEALEWLKRTTLLDKSYDSILQRVVEARSETPDDCTRWPNQVQGEL